MDGWLLVRGGFLRKISVYTGRFLPWLDIGEELCIVSGV